MTKPAPETPEKLTPAQEIVNLKAMAYDCFAQKDLLDQRINAINARISTLQREIEKNGES